MARLRYVDLSGTIGSGNLTNSATSHTFTAPLTYANGTTVPTLAGSDYFMLSILTTAGTGISEVVKVTAYNSGTGVATIARAQEGTTGVSHTSADKVQLAVYPSDMGGAGTGILAYCTYAPSFNQYSTTSGTAADVDSTNLKVTFTAPPSGSVMVHMNAYCQMYGSVTAGDWLLRDGSTTVTGSQRQMAYDASTAATFSTLNYQNIITGLTAGTSYTWKWGWLRSFGAATVFLAVGPTLPGTMTIHALP